ncbi:MAG: ribosomal-processing cysteine protease Prp [Oscillospiraceae bacterium]
MLKAVFYRHNGSPTGFSVSGHAGYGDEGTDIVCAAVSSAVMLVCNTVTDFFKVKADVSVEENRVTLRLKEKNEAAEKLLESFFYQMGTVAEEYSKVKLETHETGGK